ncbi:MAG: biotin/lipoyl-binding protein [Isosphaeraceae bacterium]|nr:biotin/lipoyl-binding protein [Isosphaeraceae bacterium]
MRKLTKYLLPLIAAAFFIFEVVNVVRARRTPPPAHVVVDPPSRPRGLRVVAGAGVIEAKRENIPLGTIVPGVVTDVYVKRGDLVKKGDPLFRIDDRDLKAQLVVREADLVASQAQLDRLLIAPQQGDIPTSQAAVAEAVAHFKDAEVAYKRSEALFLRDAEAAGDRDRDLYAYLANKATLTRMEADLKRLEATWEKDKLVARAAVGQAKSQVESVKINIERLMVRALVDGEVLQVHVRPGQLAALNWNEPMIILGDIGELHVRVDIDEQDLPYFTTKSPAVATLKGRPQVRFPLTYFDVEPYVIPKQNLTGSNTERVDTRVLQVLYALPKEKAIPLYIGQQVDVYIEAAKPPEGIKLDVDPKTIRKPFDE